MSALEQVTPNFFCLCRARPMRFGGRQARPPAALHAGLPCIVVPLVSRQAPVALWRQAVSALLLWGDVNDARTLAAAGARRLPTSESAWLLHVTAEQCTGSRSKPLQAVQTAAACLPWSVAVARERALRVIDE